ncbi:MAG: threonine aldolase family protein [Thermoplasmatota archaeon]
MRPIDLRSDTVTQPSKAMRAAMADAEVGDDVYGEDPTVQRLQEEVARLLGLEAALFVPTGTMGNQIALWVLTGRRGGVVCEEHSHVSFYEAGAAATLSNVTLRTVASRDGTFSPADVAHHWQERDPHFLEVRALSVENTHNWAGGRLWSAAATREVVDFAHARDTPVHLDGARIFNAAVAQGTTPAALACGADAVLVCLSKGLGAPVGSLVCGSEEFVAAAHPVRKMLGGGMRQAGHLAAAGLVSLSGIDRLADDHANAKEMASRLAALSGVRVGPVETNMVMMDVSGAGFTGARFLEEAKRRGVLLTARDAGDVVRIVTHKDVSRADCLDAVERLSPLFR